MKDVGQGIASLMDALVNSFQSEQLEAADALAEQPLIKEAREALESHRLDYFWLSFHPLNQAIDGLIAQAYPQSRKAQYLARHYAFVSNHFRALIEQYEGSSCCADKTRTIIKAILRSLLTSQPIQFDYQQKYTFHLPERIFKTHEEIFEFFEALLRLQAGKSDLYLQFLLKFAQKLKSD
ncbi:hypothetical protein LC612_30615 [Nostoc sp. CHAB 5834]|nr:hypothetical protein [Nostoc sp. CHAB 5834]